MRKYIIAGLIILLPLALTLMLIIFLVDLFTSPFLDWFVSFLSQYKQSIPFLQSPNVLTAIARITILIGLIIGIFILGVIARWFFFRTLLNWTNEIFSKIPFVKTIYKSIRDIIRSFITIDKRKAFQYPVMVPYPSKEIFCIAFVSGDIPEQCQKHSQEKLVSVFIPTAPHPISGYLLMIPEKELLKIDMTNEEAIKFTVSCGIITRESALDENK